MCRFSTREDVGYRRVMDAFGVVIDALLCDEAIRGEEDAIVAHNRFKER